MKIDIVGGGNLATHLNRALETKGAVSVINPHSLEGLRQDAHLILICVKDDAIQSVASRLPETSAVVAHTSGSVNMETLENASKDYGVFYPLQTFSRNDEIEYSEIPVFLEAKTPRAMETLEKAARLFSEKIKRADSEQRKRLHLASVFACNFTNALIGIAEELLEGTTIEINDLMPLMKKTLSKLEKLSPADAQTGPASRGDKKIMEAHLEMLKDDPLKQEIYSLISKKISHQN